MENSCSSLSVSPVFLVFLTHFPSKFRRMVPNGFDSLRILKATITGNNYIPGWKLKWLFNFSVFLFLVSHLSSLFSLAGSIRHHFSRLILVIIPNSHLFVFKVIHGILFVVYIHSHLTYNNSGSNRSDAESRLDADPPESLVVAESVVQEKSTKTMAVEETTTRALSSPSPVRHLNAEIESERFEENQERSKLRRSKTELNRRSSNLLDDMDLDEFNRTADRFIEVQKMYIGGRLPANSRFRQVNRRI